MTALEGGVFVGKLNNGIAVDRIVDRPAHFGIVPRFLGQVELERARTRIGDPGFGQIFVPGNHIRIFHLQSLQRAQSDVHQAVDFIVGHQRGAGFGRASPDPLECLRRWQWHPTGFGAPPVVITFVDKFGAVSIVAGQGIRASANGPSFFWIVELEGQRILICPDVLGHNADTTPNLDCEIVKLEAWVWLVEVKNNGQIVGLFDALDPFLRPCAA